MAHDMREVTTAEGAQWDALLEAHPFGRCRATSVADPYWTRVSYRLHRLAIFHDGRVAAGAALAIKRLYHLPWSVARIVALMPASQDVQGTTAALLAAAERTARDHRSLEILFDCWIPLDFEIGGIRYAEPVTQALQEARYAAVGLDRGTYLVRIDKEDEALLASFSSKARRDARKGMREGVVVRRLEALYHLKFFAGAHEVMRQRKSQIQMDGFLFEGSQPLFERGYFRLFGAEVRGKICNMALIDALGVPQYCHGATTEAAYESKVPPTGQVLHYEIMKYFRQQGSVYYDLGGAHGPVPQQRYLQYPVWRFKYEFSGAYVGLMPRYLLSLSTLGKMARAAARRLLRRAY